MILAIFGVASLVAYNLWIRKIEDTIRSNEVKAGLIAKVIVEHEKATIGVLRSFATRPLFIKALKNRDVQEVLWHFEDLVKNNAEIELIFVADSGGTLWMNYPIFKESWNKNFAYRDWYKGVSKEWNPYVSSIYKMIVGEKDLAISVCVPVFDENRNIIGILNASQTTAFFQKMIDEMGADIDSNITLIDQEAQIIYSNRIPYKKEVLRYPSLPFLKQALGGKRGNVEVRDSSDEEKTKFLSFAPVEGQGWSVIVEKSKSDILHSVYDHFVVIAVIACLTGLIAVVTGRYFGQRQKQISEMAKLNQELDTRVKERTAELKAANEELKNEVRQRTQAEEDRRASEQRLWLALDAAGMGTWDWDLDTGNIIWNERHYLLFGYTPGELKPSYESWARGVHPEDLASVEARLRQKAEECGEYHAEYRTVWADGTEHWVEARGRFECNADGKALRSYGVVVDITERKQAEMSLQESEERYRSLFENMLDGFAYCRMLFEGDRPQDFTYLAVNDAFEKLTGLKDVIGKKVTEVIPGIKESNPELFEIYGRVALKSKPERFETYLAPLDEWFSMSVYSPEKGCFVAVFEIITERKRIEEELRKERDFSRAVLDTAGALVVVLDKEGRITGFNKACEALSGYSAAEVMGRSWNFLISPEEFPVVMQAWEVLKAGNFPHHHENLLVSKDGSRHLITWSNTALFSRLGEIEHIIGTGVDITDLRHMEEELRRSHDELEIKVQERTAELVGANKKLREEIARREKAEQQLLQAQKMESIGTLTGGIAHDLNNILAPIVINSEMALLDLDGNPELRETLGLILKSGLRGRDLVKQLLLFSRKSEKKQEIVPLIPLISDSFKLLRASIPATIGMKLHLETDTDKVYADASQIQQVIMNVCANAAYAMRGTTGSIEISLQTYTPGSDDLPEPDMEPGGYLLISIKDTGSGMPEEVRKRVFEPFFTTKPAGEGTGLGLSVVYGIVKNHKGNITVYSEPGKGSIFKVYLPKVETKAAEKGEFIKPIPRGDERVLLVDDEEFIINSVRNMLQQLGYKVTAIMDSREALKLFSADPSQFDLVMTDQTMSFMTGEILGKEMMRIRPDIPVILCTGYADFISSEKAKEMGFHGFIMKPFTVREGAELVRRVLDQKESSNC